MDKDIALSWWLTAIQVASAAILICFPLCLPRELNKLRYASLLSIVTIMYTILVVLIEFPFYMKQNLFDIEEPMVIKWAKMDTEFFVAASMTFLAYTCQQNVFTVYSEMERPSERRIKKV